MPVIANPPLPEFIRFGRVVCGDRAQAERREWWLSNGLGGNAAGTVAGSLTRRYHSLLIASVHPPLGAVEPRSGTSCEPQQRHRRATAWRTTRSITQPDYGRETTWQNLN